MGWVFIDLKDVKMIETMMGFNNIVSTLCFRSIHSGLESAPCGTGGSHRSRLTHLDQTLSAVQGDAQALQQGAAALALDQLKERHAVRSGCYGYSQAKTGGLAPGEPMSVSGNEVDALSERPPLNSAAQRRPGSALNPCTPPAAAHGVTGTRTALDHPVLRSCSVTAQLQEADRTHRVCTRLSRTSGSTRTADGSHDS